jgi:hypothetical protein
MELPHCLPDTASLHAFFTAALLKDLIALDTPQQLTQV